MSDCYLPSDEETIQEQTSRIQRLNLGHVTQKSTDVGINRKVTESGNESAIKKEVSHMHRQVEVLRANPNRTEGSRMMRATTLQHRKPTKRRVPQAPMTFPIPPSKKNAFTSRYRAYIQGGNGTRSNLEQQAIRCHFPKFYGMANPRGGYRSYSGTGVTCELCHTEEMPYHAIQAHEDTKGRTVIHHFCSVISC